jgi:hypothetical protein
MLRSIHNPQQDRPKEPKSRGRAKDQAWTARFPTKRRGPDPWASTRERGNFPWSRDSQGAGQGLQVSGPECSCTVQHTCTVHEITVRYMLCSGWASPRYGYTKLVPLSSLPGMDSESRRRRTNTTEGGQIVVLDGGDCCCRC